MGDEDIPGFLAGLDPQRRAEAEALTALFGQVTGFAPALWPGKIIGFGRYAYRYDSGHSGETLAVGFSPRKAEISLYVNDLDPGLLEHLGRHRAGKGCLWLKRLADADAAVLAQVVARGFAEVSKRWEVTGPRLQLDKSTQA